MGCFIGSRDEDGAIGLWHSLPDCYLDAETYTDFWQAYPAIFYDQTLHQGSNTETGVFRYKTILGATLNARLFESQTVEMKLGGKILNKMSALGMPVSLPVAA